MIERICGTLAEKQPTHVLVDCGGVGYGLSISLSTFQGLPDAGSEVTLLTYLHVREDIMRLYGFLTPAERALFILLISVSKIGPKTAQAMLSGISVERFIHAVQTDNTGLLTRIPGIGKQGAERIVVELKGKIQKLDQAGALRPEDKGKVSAFTRNAEQAVLALESLGYKRSFAEKAVGKVIEEKGAELPVEELIKTALKFV
jgi:Holliday junction DNA helicase RuvA